MQNFEDAFKTCKGSFITAFSICMTVPSSKTFDDLEHLLKCTTKVFDIVAVSGTRIFKKTLLTSHIELQNYSFEFTPTKSSAGGTLLYTANRLSYKPHTDLCLNKANYLESTFIENSGKINIIVSVAFINILIGMFLSLIKIILAPFLTNYPRETNKFFFLLILILTY